MSRVVRVLTAVMIASATSLLFLTTPASTAQNSPDANELLALTCTPPSSDVVAYDPPLTNTPQTTDFTLSMQFDPCVSVTRPDITSGTSSVETTVERSCLQLLDNFEFTHTIVWNTGETSTMSGPVTVNVVGAALVATHTGTVTDGVFEGDSFVRVVTGPATDVLLCTLGLGTVSSVESVVTLQIISP